MNAPITTRHVNVPDRLLICVLGGAGHDRALSRERRGPAPLPPRCLRDSRFTAEHYRVLGIIARHDGMGQNGTGCYARDKTLAAEIALPESTVKTRITELMAMEYVHERPSERHAGVLHRRVMYTDEDRGVMRSRRARPGVAADLPAVVARALRSPVR